MDLKGMIRDIPDFPKPGIVYKDITPILSDGAALRYVIDSFADRYRGRIDAVAGIESRGFILGAPVAYALGVGLATAIRERNPMLDGFGLIAFASLMPIIFVMAYGMLR